MSKKEIGKVESDIHEETVTSFKRQEDGTYKKILIRSSRDRKTNIVKEFDAEELDEIYEKVLGDVYDEKLLFTTPSGDDLSLKLKRIN
jgi:hypothetical protein